MEEAAYARSLARSWRRVPGPCVRVRAARCPSVRRPSCGRGAVHVAGLLVLPPPADAIVADLARTRPDLLPLTFHVTYWNSLGWQDLFSFPGATERQRHYVAEAVSPEAYTPAMVVDGRRDVVGSDRAAVAATLARAAADATTEARVEVTRTGHSTGDTLSITIGARTGQGAVLVIGYDRQHRTTVGRGENSGRTLLEANIVRSMAIAGAWTGQALHLDVAVPAGEEFAVIVQAETGRVLGAARLA